MARREASGKAVAFRQHSRGCRLKKSSNQLLYSMSQPIRRGATGISEQVLHSKEGIEQEELALRRLRHAYREELDRVKVRLGWRQYRYR